MKCRSIVYALGVLSLLLSLAGAIFGGKAASNAVSTTTISDARSSAIWATVMSSLNMLVCIGVMGFVAYHSKKSE